MKLSSKNLAERTDTLYDAIVAGGVQAVCLPPFTWLAMV